MLRCQGLEIANTAGILPVQTSATGSNWVQLTASALPANQVVIYNTSGVTLRVRYCDLSGNPRAGQTYLLIPNGVAQPLRGITNAQLVQIQRDDQSNTQVTVSFYYESV